MDRRPSSEPSGPFAGALGRAPLLRRIALLVGAADLIVATRDFVIQPLLASPADPQAALRNGALIAAVTVGVVRLVWRRPGAAPPDSTSRPAPESGVDVLLACLASLEAGAGDDPATLAVHAGDPVVEVFWSGPPPAPPPPWRSSDTGWVWEAERAQLRAARPRDQRPWSLLIAAGATPTGTLWLNLAAFRVVALGGDPAAVARRAGAIVRALEHRAATGGAELLVIDEPGSDPDASPDDRTVEQALSRLWRRTARRNDGRGLDPLVVVAMAGPAIDRLEPAARLDAAVTLVVMGDVGVADLRLRCEDGRVTVPFLGGVVLRVAAEPHREPETAAASGASDTPSPPAPDEDRPSSSGPAGAVEVRVLGPVEAQGAAGALAGKSLELVVYLACHPDGALDDQIRCALWPERPPAAATWAQRVSVTRRALGVDADGSPRLRRFRQHVGRLSPSVRSDVGQLEVALARCRETATPAAADGLAALLERVRGRPFDAPRGYGWADDEGHLARAEQAVVEAAHYLAEHAIEAGDWERALSASERGLRACPTSDVLLADRDQAAATGGVSAGALATRALRDALKDLDPRLGLTLPNLEVDASRVTGADS